MKYLVRVAWQVSLSLALMWLSGQYPIYLPGAALPVTLQSMMCILLPLILVPRNASGGILLYLLLGALGVPVFAGGTGGMDYFLSGSGGYLAGFYIVSVISGYSRKFLVHPRFVKAFGLFMLMHVLLTLFGLGWMALNDPGSIKFATHVSPFLVGMVVKSFIGAALFELKHLLSRKAQHS